jgi:cysteine synthase A
LVDEVIQVTSEESIAEAQQIGRTEGFVVGISSGAAAAAVRKLAARDEFAGKRIVAMMPDIGERYISTLLFYRD